MTDGLCVNAVVKRNDPRDAYLSYKNKSFKELKPNSKIGTSSFRRHAQLSLLRNDLKILAMRGNIDTRIKKLKNKEYDAIVLSLAGVDMLNLKKDNEDISEKRLLIFSELKFDSKIKSSFTVLLKLFL